MNPLPLTSPSPMVGASAPTTTVSSRGSIDADRVAALKSEIQKWNARKLPPVEMAVGALEFLATGSVEGFERAQDAPPPLERGEGRRSVAFGWSVPEMVESALKRGASLHYTLGMDPGLIALGNQMSRGWHRLPESRRVLKAQVLSSSPAGAQRRPGAYTPPAPFFKKLIDELRHGECVMLKLPSNDLLTMARAVGGQLIAVAANERASRSPGVCPSEVYEGARAQERFDRAYYMPGHEAWAVLRPQ